jgi:tRNA threonylcarbamoyl adenosine modification protein YeaZ
MKVLAVETATSWQSVAIHDDSRVLARYDHDAAGSHAKLLLPTIDRLLRETGLTLKQLDGLAVSIGPGGFTAIRLAVTDARGRAEAAAAGAGRNIDRIIKIEEGERPPLPRPRSTRNPLSWPTW